MDLLEIALKSRSSDRIMTAIEDSLPRDFKDRAGSNRVSMAQELVERKIVPIVIKPEGLLANGLEVVTTGLKKRGVKIISIEIIDHPDLNTWFIRYRNVIELYSEDFEPILPDLAKLNGENPWGIVTIKCGPELDLTRLKKEIIGGSGEEGKSSIRSKLKSLIAKAGFYNGNNPALRETVFPKRTLPENRRTFNGVHCPRTTEEAIRDLAIHLGEPDLDKLLNISTKLTKSRY